MSGISLEYLKKKVDKITKVKVSSYTITIFTDTQQAVIKLEESLFTYKGVFTVNLSTLDKDNLVVEYDGLRRYLTVCKDFIVIESTNPLGIIDFVSIEEIRITDLSEVQ